MSLSISGTTAAWTVGEQLTDVALELTSPMRRGVLGEHAPACSRADRHPLRLRYLAQVAERVVRAAGDENLVAEVEEGGQAVPVVADDRRAAGGGLEEAHAWRVAGRDHVGSRDVQRKLLRVVEGPVLPWREVRHASHVARPPDGLRILRPRDDEAPPPPPP